MNSGALATSPTAHAGCVDRFVNLLPRYDPNPVVECGRVGAPPSAELRAHGLRCVRAEDLADMARDKVGIRGIWYCGTAAHWRQQMEGVLRAHHGSLSAHAAVHVRTLGSGDAADDLRDTLDSAGFNVLDAGCPAGTAPGENCLLAVKREACCAGGIKAFYDRIRLD